MRISKASTAGDVVGNLSAYVAMISLVLASPELFEQDGWSYWLIPLVVVVIATVSLVIYFVAATTVDLIVWRHRNRTRP